MIPAYDSRPLLQLSSFLGVIVCVPIQCAIRLILSDRTVHGTAWSIDGARVIVTARASIPPGSHARLELELGNHEGMSKDTVVGDAMVWSATRTGDTQSGTRRYSVEMRAMSHAHQLHLGQWLEARRDVADAGLEEPTDMLLGGTQSLTPPVHERHTELTPVHDRPPANKADSTIANNTSRRAAKASTRQARATRAHISHDRVNKRLHLFWKNLDDLHTDWLCSLSHGVIYLPNVELEAGEAIILIAVLPDGRRALLSGRASARSRGVTMVNINIGHTARALLQHQGTPVHTSVA